MKRRPVLMTAFVTPLVENTSLVTSIIDCQMSAIDACANCGTIRVVHTHTQKMPLQQSPKGEDMGFFKGVG